MDQPPDNASHIVERLRDLRTRMEKAKPFVDVATSMLMRLKELEKSRKEGIASNSQKVSELQQLRIQQERCAAFFAESGENVQKIKEDNIRLQAEKETLFNNLKELQKEHTKHINDINAMYSEKMEAMQRQRQIDLQEILSETSKSETLYREEVAFLSNKLREMQDLNSEESRRLKEDLQNETAYFRQKSERLEREVEERDANLSIYRLVLKNVEYESIEKKESKTPTQQWLPASNKSAHQAQTSTSKQASVTYRHLPVQKLRLNANSTEEENQGASTENSGPKKKKTV